jgi:hypothetical protein
MEGTDRVQPKRVAVESRELHMSTLNPDRRSIPLVTFPRALQQLAVVWMHPQSRRARWW